MSVTNLKTRIMRRVYFIYVLRKILSPAMLKVYILIALVGYSASYVSFGNVFKNTLAIFDTSGLYHFFSYAFMNTELAVQISVVAGALLLLWLVWDGCKRFILPDSSHFRFNVSH